VGPVTDGRPRLLFCVHGAERTGPPVLLLRFARWLHALDVVDLDFVLLRDGPLLDEFAVLGRVIVLDEFEAPGRLRDRLLRRKLAPFAAPDLVYVNTGGSVRALRYLDAGTAPVVAQVHELSVGLEYWLDAEDLDLLLRSADRLLVVSDAVRRDLVDHHGVDPDGIALHPGFVAEVPASRPTPPAERPPGLLVGSSGTVDWRKAVDLFVLLAGDVLARSHDTEVTFVWIGGGPDSPLRPAVDRDARLADLGERLRFVDEVADPRPWLAALDVFVLPAREDAFPLVCLEAASVGVPIVCFDNGGAAELVEAADGGAVVAYPDLAAFGDAVVALLEDAEARQDAGRRVRDHVATHHTTAVAAPRLWAELEALL
jgi:glycosyltransferase involved in cell wall biosynthesis